MAAKSEREEALLSLSITGGLLFGCFGLYYALTSAAGIDEVLAGQLVLLVLVAFGAYLVFFGKSLGRFVRRSCSDFEGRARTRRERGS